MALRAAHAEVRARQRKPSSIMIESSTTPTTGIMAQRAIMTVSQLLVVGIGGSFVIGLMTRPAIRGGTVVHAVHMALRATGVDMRAGEREIRAAVIKARRRPAVGRVTYGAVVIIIPGDMIRIGHAFVIRLMTRPAIRRSAGKLSVDMAQGAVHADMRSRQWELRLIMIEG